MLRNSICVAIHFKSRNLHIITLWSYTYHCSRLIPLYLLVRFEFKIDQ